MITVVTEPSETAGECFFFSYTGFVGYRPGLFSQRHNNAYHENDHNNKHNETHKER